MSKSNKNYSFAIIALRYNGSEPVYKKVVLFSSNTHKKSKRAKFLDDKLKEYGETFQLSYEDIVIETYDTNVIDINLWELRKFTSIIRINGYYVFFETNNYYFVSTEADYTKIFKVSKEDSILKQ